MEVWNGIWKKILVWNRIWKKILVWNGIWYGRFLVIRKSLNIEPLLLRIERSQLRWFGHVSRMPPERLPKQALHAKASGRRPVGRPRTRWTDYIEDLGWNRLGLRPSEMMEVMEDREVWRLNLELLPPQPSRKSGQWRKKKKKKKIFSMEWKWNGRKLPVWNMEKSSSIPFHTMPWLRLIVFFNGDLCKT